MLLLRPVLAQFLVLLPPVMLKWRHPMDFFFIKDSKWRYRFFASEPAPGIGVKISKSREIWEQAKKKLLLLPPRILRQEQAFINILKNKDERVVVHHSGRHAEKRLRLIFFLYLQKQKTKHLLLLLGEALLLPLSGLAAFIPGPNIAFYILALLLITHWQAWRGISRLGRKKIEFEAASPFLAWEKAIDLKQEERFPEILGKLEKEFNLRGLSKILWK